jgi:hypothetical protein
MGGAATSDVELWGDRAIALGAPAHELSRMFG